MAGVLVPNIPILPDLRNGALATIVPTIRAAAIPTSTHWVEVAGPGVMGNRGAASIEWFVRGHYAHMLGLRIREIAAGPPAVPVPAGGAAAAFMAVLALVAVADLTAIRKASIAIGATRAGVQGSWNIVVADLLPAERVASIYTVAALPLPGVGAIGVLTSGHGPNALTLEEVVATGMAPMTPEELELAYLFVQMGMCLPPLNGLTLLSTGHHFLSSSVTAYKAVERQLLGNSEPGVTAAWRADRDMYVDLAWHKACHPVNAHLLTTFAISPVVPQRLARAGFGSAAVRLPYAESPLRAAEAGVALMNACKVVLLSANYMVSMPHLEAALAYTMSFPQVAAPAPGVPPAAAAAPAVVAPPAGARFVGVATRADAITNVLEPATQAAQPVIAWFAGFYTSVLASAEGRNRESSLLTAYSVVRAAESNGGSYSLGSGSYNLYMRFARAMVDNGDLPPVVITD